MKNLSVKHYTIISITILLILCYFSLFYRLGVQPMQRWDESSYALNAQEMLERGNPIEVFLFGNPDIYNSKPPFAIWNMAIFIKIFGFNEIGVRMASAFFALLSALVLWFIGSKNTNSKIMGLIFPLILISSVGYVGQHMARTGDTDVIVAFWILVQSALIFGYTNTESEKEANRYLLLASLAISFGCLTKGIAGLTVLPGIFIWLLVSKKLIPTLRKKEFYISIVIFLFLVVGYYILRGKLTDGYLDAVWENEIGGRLHRQDFLNETELPFYYYISSMFTFQRFFLWVIILPISVIYIFISPADSLKKLGTFFTVILLSILLLLSLSKTKTPWYDSPLYPLMAMVIGTSFCIFIKRFGAKFSILFIFLFIWPYSKVLANNMGKAKEGSTGKLMKKIRTKIDKTNTIYIINNGKNFPLYFYSKQDQLNGYKSDVVAHDYEKLQSGTFIITATNDEDVLVKNTYNLKTISSYKECTYYQIISKK